MTDQADINVEDLLARIAKLEALLQQQPAAESSNADIWFLLDRSGSMSTIAQYVVQGFDDFLAEQRKEKGNATMTLVQFDTQDIHEVLADAEPVAKVSSIAGRFTPRGGTPLYDAIALLLDRAEAHLKRSGGHPADQLVVILTDGHENSSLQWNAPMVFKRIAGLQQAGWTFVFMGANQDSYATGSAMGVVEGNTSNFVASPTGVLAAQAGLSRAVKGWRAKPRATRLADAEDFWDGVKEGEQEGAGR